MLNMRYPPLPLTQISYFLVTLIIMANNIGNLASDAENMLPTSVPMDTIQSLWNDLKDHNWGALKDAISQRMQQQKNDANSIWEKLMSVIDNLRGQPFPNTASDLKNMIESKAQDMLSNK